ncbi:MAG: hypothetical protein JJ916_10500 [Phycisphaerales bacterium]|nr:hypothetical protein [Phycisphaerales bacterium]
MAAQNSSETLNPGTPIKTITGNWDPNTSRPVSKTHDAVILYISNTEFVNVRIHGETSFQLPAGNHQLAYSNPHSQVGGIFVPRGAVVEISFPSGRGALCFIHAYEIQ